jgi:hypothetical protein
MTAARVEWRVTMLDKSNTSDKPMSQAEPTTHLAESEAFCINHPNVATRLRCNRCGNPICIKCAVRTPVGYRCKSCVKSQQAVFYTAMPTDYIVAAVITLPLAAIGQFLVSLGGLMLGFLILFGAPVVGGLIAELVYRANGKRRGQYTWLVVSGCIVIGALPAVGLALLTFNLFNLALHGIYLILTAGSAVARLRFGK